MGNHRDAWVYGAGDALSGTICMMEVTRVLGQMYDGVSGKMYLFSFDFLMN